MVYLENGKLAKDSLVINPQFNLSQLTYLLSTIAFARKISEISGTDILNNFETTMKMSFSKSGVPVVIKARNEENDLPKLLYALSRSNTSTNPIIIDNGSGDSTPAIGASLGLTVIEEKAVGVVPGSVAAFNHIREAKLDTKPVLFSDADGIPGTKWVSSMLDLLARVDENGGIGYGLYAYFGGQYISDFLLTSAYQMKSLAAFHLRNKVTAHGGNSGIKFDNKGKILDACSKLDTQFTIGLGGLIRDSVKSAGGIAVRSFDPSTLSPTRSDRMPNLYSVFKLFISQRREILRQYEKWFSDHPGTNYNDYIESKKKHKLNNSRTYN